MDQDFGGPRQFTDGNESVELALRTLVDWLLRSKLDRNTYHYESVKTLRYALKNATYPKVMSFTDALGHIPSPNTISQNQVPESRNCVIFTTPSECRDLLSRAPLTLPVYLPDGNIPASRVTLQQCFNFLADRFHDIPGICYMDVLSCPRPSPPSVGCPPRRILSPGSIATRFARREPLDCPDLPCLAHSPFPDFMGELQNYSYLRLVHENSRAGKRDIAIAHDLSDNVTSMEIASATTIKTPRRAPNGVTQILRVEQGQVAFLLWPCVTDGELIEWQTRQGQELFPSRDEKIAVPQLPSSVINMEPGGVLLIPPDCLFMQIALEATIITKVRVWDTRTIAKVPRAMQLDAQIPDIIKDERVFQCQYKLRRAVDAWENGNLFWEFPEYRQLPSFRHAVEQLGRSPKFVYIASQQWEESKILTV